jgi:hypothetical protein
MSPVSIAIASREIIRLDKGGSQPGFGINPILAIASREIIRLDKGGSQPGFGMKNQLDWQ